MTAIRFALACLLTVSIAGCTSSGEKERLRAASVRELDGAGEARPAGSSAHPGYGTPVSSGQQSQMAADAHSHDDGHDHEGHDHAAHAGDEHEGHDHAAHEGHDHGAATATSTDHPAAHADAVKPETHGVERAPAAMTEGAKSAPAGSGPGADAACKCGYDCGCAHCEGGGIPCGCS